MRPTTSQHPLRSSAVLAAVVCGVALVTSGCGGSPKPTAATATTTSEVPGISGGGGSATTDTAGAATSGTANPAGSGTPASAAAADRSAALAALNAFAAALATGDFDRVSATVAGPLVPLATVEDLNREYNAAHGAATQVTVTSSGLAITSMSGGSAVGAGTVRRTTRAGGGSQTETFAGPFTLTDTAGGWRVAGATYDGATLAAVEYRKVVTQDGLRVELVSLLDFGRSTAALVTVGNTAGGTSVLELRGADLTRNGVTTASQADIAVATSSGTVEGYAGLVRSTGTPTKLVVHLAKGGTPVEVTFTLS